MALTKSLKEIIAEDKTGLLGKHASWERVCLRDVAEVLNGYPFESNLFQSANGMPLIRIRDVQNGSTSTYFSGEFDNQFLVNHGELLVGMDGDFNSARWKAKPSLLNQRVCKLTADERFYSGRLLELVLPGFLAAIHAETSSVTVKHLSSRSIQEIELPLPPAAEQTRIVEKLEELLSDLDAGVAELKAAQKKLIQYRQSLLKAAVDGALTADWRSAHRANDEAETGAQLLARILTERRSRWEIRQRAKFQAQGKPPPKDWQAKYPAPVAPDTKALPELPQGWVWASVEQVAEVISGFAFQSGDFLQTGVAVTKIANVGYGVYASDSTQEFLSSEFLLEYSDFNVCSDDILIALTRPITNNTLKSCRYPKNSLPSLLNQRVAMIKVVLEETAEYIYAVTRTPYFREAVRGSTSETLQPNMSPNSLKSIGLPLPPLVEAAVIFEMLNVHLNEVDLQEIAITQSLKQSAAQRKNILQAAFSGQLVPQDPADEPASALLARIRAERQERASLGKTKKSNSYLRRSSPC